MLMPDFCQAFFYIFLEPVHLIDHFQKVIQGSYFIIAQSQKFD